MGSFSPSIEYFEGVVAGRCGGQGNQGSRAQVFNGRDFRFSVEQYVHWGVATFPAILVRILLVTGAEAAERQVCSQSARRASSLWLPSHKRGLLCTWPLALCLGQHWLLTT